MFFLDLGTSLLKRKTVEPLNLGGLTKSAAAMMAAKHASALKASSNEVGDGDVEVVGVVPGNGQKLISKQLGDKSDFLNKISQQLPLGADAKGNGAGTASSALANAAARQMAASGVDDLSTSSSGIDFGNLASAYSSIGGSNSSYNSLMAAAAARDPYYQALLASGLGGSSGNATSSTSTGGANTVDLLQKCKLKTCSIKYNIWCLKVQ